MHKLFALRSQKTGRIYRVPALEVASFYAEHVLGAIAASVRSSVSRLCIQGTVLCELFRDGELVDVRCGPNLITTAGIGFVVDRFQGTPAVADYIAIGTGTTAANAADTTIETEVARAQGTLSQPTAATDRVVATFAAGTGTGAITEMGRLNAASTGTLVARQVFSVINKGASDSLQVTHDILPADGS